jgi:hypothetical protein
VRPLQAPENTTFPEYDITIVIEVVIRPVSITAPHEYTEGTHEMTWKLVPPKASDTKAVACLKYMNTVSLDLGHWTHLMNTNFKHSAPVQSSYSAPSPLPALRFRNLKDFENQVVPRDRSCPMASWRNMDVSQIPTSRLDIVWKVGIRSRARDYEPAHHWVSLNNIDWQLGTGEVGRKCRLALRQMMPLFEEKDAATCLEKCKKCKKCKGGLMPKL